MQAIVEHKAFLDSLLVRMGAFLSGVINWTKHIKIPKRRSIFILIIFTSFFLLYACSLWKSWRHV